MKNTNRKKTEIFISTFFQESKWSNPKKETADWRKYGINTRLSGFFLSVFTLHQTFKQVVKSILQLKETTSAEQSLEMSKG